MIDAILLITVTGAVVISALSYPQSQRQRAAITLAAIATETYANSREGVDPSSGEQSQSMGEGSMTSASNDVHGGWATTEVSV